MEEYSYVSTLGEGTYGYVWKCQEHSSGRIVAIKALKAAHVDPEVRRMALREVRVLQGLAHPAIIPLLDAFRSNSGRIYMVFPYMPRSASAALQDHPGGLPAHELKLLAWQLLQALSYLHARKVVHRDIKPSNILMSHSGEVRLCDFGFARPTHCDAQGAEPMSPYVITRWYRPPEVLVGGEYGPAADVWSLGCTLAQLATGVPLFQGKSTLDQLWRILRCFGSLPPAQSARAACDPRLRPLRTLPLGGRCLRQRLPACEPGLVQLLEACLQPDPARRGTAEQLLQSPYFWVVPRLITGTQLGALYGDARPAATAELAAVSLPPASDAAKQQRHGRPSVEASQGSTMGHAPAPPTPMPQRHPHGARLRREDEQAHQQALAACPAATGPRRAKSSAAACASLSPHGQREDGFKAAGHMREGSLRSGHARAADDAAYGTPATSAHTLALSLSASPRAPATAAAPSPKQRLLNTPGSTAARPSALLQTRIASGAAALSPCASSVRLRACDTVDFDCHPSFPAFTPGPYRASPGAPLPSARSSESGDSKGTSNTAALASPGSVLRQDSFGDTTSDSFEDQDPCHSEDEPPEPPTAPSAAAAAPPPSFRPAAARRGRHAAAANGFATSSQPPLLLQQQERHLAAPGTTMKGELVMAAAPRPDCRAAIVGEGARTVAPPRGEDTTGTPTSQHQGVGPIRLHSRSQMHQLPHSRSRRRMLSLRADERPSMRPEPSPGAGGHTVAFVPATVFACATAGDEPSPRQCGGGLPGVPAPADDLDELSGKDSDIVYRVTSTATGSEAASFSMPAWMAAGFSSLPVQYVCEGNGVAAAAALTGEVAAAPRRKRHTSHAAVLQRTSRGDGGVLPGASAAGYSVHSSRLLAAVAAGSSGGSGGAVGSAASGKAGYARNRSSSHANWAISGPCEVCDASMLRDARRGTHAGAAGPASTGNCDIGCGDVRQRQEEARRHASGAAHAAAAVPAMVMPMFIAASPPPVTRPFLPSPSACVDGGAAGSVAPAAAVRAAVEGSDDGQACKQGRASEEEGVKGSLVKLFRALKRAMSSANEEHAR